MKDRLCCNPEQRRPANKPAWQVLSVAACGFLLSALACAGDTAPAWMHNLVNVPLPTYDDKTEAVLLYSDTSVTVLSADKIKTQVREAYKILRPEGRQYGTVHVYFNPERKIKSLHGWCVPAQGKDYEVKDKDAIDIAAVGSGELVGDAKFRVLHIPASDVGNIVGYEYEVEERPFFLQDTWPFQEETPVRETTTLSNFPRRGNSRAPG